MICPCGHSDGAPGLVSYVGVAREVHTAEGGFTCCRCIPYVVGDLLGPSFQEAERVFEQGVGRLRAELAGDKEAGLSALRRETDEELQVTQRPRVFQRNSFLFWGGRCLEENALRGYSLHTT